MLEFKSKDFQVRPSGRWRAKQLHQNLVVVHDGSFEAAGRIDDLPEVATVERIDDHGGEESLAAFAARVMRGHVAQGEPARSHETLGGVPANVYEWTDGVTKIVTWFVEPYARKWFRIDYAIKDPTTSWAQLRPRARALLADFRWTGTGAAAV